MTNCTALCLSYGVYLGLFDSELKINDLGCVPIVPWHENVCDELLKVSNFHFGLFNQIYEMAEVHFVFQDALIKFIVSLLSHSLDIANRRLK